MKAIRNFQMISVAAIEPDPRNPRMHAAAADVSTLADSLKQIDLLSPICVRPTPGKSGRFTLIAGERRFHAARKAKWAEVPCFVRDVSSVEAVKMMVSENSMQRPLNPIEVARAICLLIDVAGLTQIEAGKHFGHGQSWVANTLRLLRLPEPWQQRVARGELNSHKARALVPYCERPQVLALVDVDMQANPGDWEKTGDFEQRLAFVVQQLDGLEAEVAATSNQAGQVHAGTEGGSPIAPNTARRSGIVDHTLPVDEKPAAAILRLLGLVNDLEDLDRIQRSLYARAAKLREPEPQEANRGGHLKLTGVATAKADRQPGRSQRATSKH